MKVDKQNKAIEKNILKANKNSVARFFITLFIILILLISPFFAIVGYNCLLPQQYDKTFLAAMADKYNLLKNTNDKKIVLVGGSNLPFGIDSQMIEHELNIKVVNFGLYAALGTKTTMDLSKANINKGDIVVLVPEFSAQTYSKYINGEIMLQTLDTKKSMIWNIPADDWFTLANSYPTFMSHKKDLIIKGDKPNPNTVYARSSFNKFGDIKYPRPYNVLPDMFDTANMITIDKNIISNDFVEYFNKYVKWIKRRNAMVCLSFPPVNKSALTKETTYEKRVEFYDYARRVFDADIISNIEDYILHEDYFYDSNYHLNDSGVIARTVKIIGDLKRTLGILTPTNIKIPDGSGAENKGDDTENDNADNELAKDFVMELVNDKYVLIGLSSRGKAKEFLKIPATLNGKIVYKIRANAFLDETFLREIIISQSISVLEDSIFSGAKNLIKVTLNLDKSLNIKLPQVGSNLLDNANKDIKIYVPKNKYALMKSDYFWSKYSDKFEMLV